MYEEQLLISMGMPYSEALGVCYAMRKEGRLKEFMQSQIKAYERECMKLEKEDVD